MGRIYNDFNIVLDLENIKYIKHEFDQYNNPVVCIELLRGNEFVYNSEKEEFVLIKPIIEINCSHGGANVIINDIAKKWEEYYASKESDKR